MPLLSVIVPTFNRAPFLEACIASIRSSGIPDLEVIVVDDGSTDDTETIVAGLAAPIRYVRQTNQGPAAARNLGVATSTGQFICFLDSDDVWLPEGPARLLALLQAYPQYGAAFGDASVGNHESGYASFFETFGGDAFRALPGTRIERDVKVIERHHLFRRLSTRNVMFLGSLMLRRECVADVGEFYACGTEDWDWFMRLVVSREVLCLERPRISKYLKHEVSITANGDRMNRDFMRALSHVQDVVDLDPEDRAHVAALLKVHRFDYGYAAYDRGQLEEARRRFADAMRESGVSVRPLLYFLLCSAPSSLVAGLRRLKQRTAA